MFTEPDAFTGASAVLVTHEHPDHFAPDRLRAALDADPALEVWTNGSVAGLLDGLGEPGARRGPGGRGDRRGLRRARPRGAARRDPPGDPADPQRRVPGRRSGVPSGGCAHRARRAGGDAAAAAACALVAHRGPDRVRAGRARRPGVRRARRTAQRRRTRHRRWAAGRARAGYAHAAAPGWPRGTRSSSESPAESPGNGVSGRRRASDRRRCPRRRRSAARLRSRR